MPAYNEEKNIEDVVRSWYLLLDHGDENSRLVIADSGSTDRTHELLIGLQREMPGLVILNDTLKQHGPKLIALYRYSIANNADFIFQTDSDGQTDPAEFEAFWNDRDSFDAIIGNRTVRGDGKTRKFVENVVCLLLRLIFGIKVSDANAPFRLMNSKLLSKYIGRFKDDYNLPNIMLVVFFKYYTENVTFREISFQARTKGKTSVNMPRIIKIGLHAISDFYRFKKDL